MRLRVELGLLLLATIQTSQAQHHRMRRQNPLPLQGSLILMNCVIPVQGWEYWAEMKKFWINIWDGEVRRRGREWEQAYLDHHEPMPDIFQPSNGMLAVESITSAWDVERTIKLNIIPEGTKYTGRSSNLIKQLLGTVYAESDALAVEYKRSGLNWEYGVYEEKNTVLNQRIQDLSNELSSAEIAEHRTMRSSSMEGIEMIKIDVTAEAGVAKLMDSTSNFMASTTLVFLYEIAPIMVYGIVDIMIQRKKSSDAAAVAETVKLRRDIGRSVTPEAIFKEGCRNIHNSVTREEGILSETFAVHIVDHASPLMMLHHMAYENATNEMISKISTFPVIDWGAPAVLPSVPYIHINSGEARQMDTAYQKDLKRWQAQEFLRPLQLQSDLMHQYQQQIHESAFNFMMTTPLFDVNDVAAAKAILMLGGFQSRMNIPSGCYEHINEPKVIKAFFNQPRSFQAVRHSRLKLAADPYFAARSALPPVLPAPALIRPRQDLPPTALAE